MKKYNKPELEIKTLVNNDVITTSEGGEEVVGRYLKTKVAGNEGKNYGQQSVTIFD